MSFSSFNNTSPMLFYFISIVSFVVANVIREINTGLYYGLLIVGVIFFFLGIMRRIKR